jgi:hypothetical protein
MQTAVGRVDGEASPPLLYEFQTNVLVFSAQAYIGVDPVCDPIVFTQYDTYPDEE